MKNADINSIVGIDMFDENGFITGNLNNVKAIANVVKNAELNKGHHKGVSLRCCHRFCFFKLL
jgi:hypothetical protein